MSSTKPVAEPNATSLLGWFSDALEEVYHRLHSIIAGPDSRSLHTSSTPTEKKKAVGRSVRALLCRLLTMLGKLTGKEARREEKARRVKEWHAYQVTLEGTERKIAQYRHQLSRLEDRGSVTQITQRIAAEKDMPVQDVRDSLQMISAETAEAIPIQLNEALKTLAELQHHHARLRDLQVAARAK